MRPVILILSCQRDMVKGCNDAIRNTWARTSLIPYKFFLGRGATVQHEDEIAVDADDNTAGLTAKVQASVRWALDAGYTHFFNACTDTYVNTSRLLNSQFERADYIGQLPLLSSDIRFCQHGAGFWLSTQAGLLLTGDQSAQFSCPHADDAWIGEFMASVGIEAVNDPRYSMGQTWHYNQEPVLKTNDIISCHLSRHSSPEALLRRDASLLYDPRWMWEAYEADIG
jgi:hypothetical protein